MDAKQSALYDYISDVTSQIRKAKTAAGVSQRTPVLKVLIKAPKNVLDTLKDGIDDIQNVGGLQENALEFENSDTLSIENISLDLSAIPQK